MATRKRNPGEWAVYYAGKYVGDVEARTEDGARNRAYSQLEPAAGRWEPARLSVGRR